MGWKVQVENWGSKQDCLVVAWAQGGDTWRKGRHEDRQRGRSVIVCMDGDWCGPQ